MAAGIKTKHGRSTEPATRDGSKLVRTRKPSPGAFERCNAATIRLLLVGLRSPVNIGMILRVAETYRVDVALFDCDAVIEEESRMATIRDFACGALDRRGFARLGTMQELLDWIGGSRLVATTISKTAVILPNFRFERGDVIAFGSEYDGLEDRIASQSDVSMTIPMADVWTPKPPSSRPIDPARAAPPSNDGQPNLNVALSAGIVCYAAFVGGDGASKGN